MSATVTELPRRWDARPTPVPRGFTRIGDIEEPPYPPFIIDDVLHDTATVMFGRPEAGKSWLSLSMANSLVTGEPWLGHEVRERRSVALWQLDNGQRFETKRRIREAGFTALNDMPIRWSRPERDDSDWGESLARDLEAAQVNFLIVDNLMRLRPRGKSLLDDAAICGVLENLSVIANNRIGVLLLHHAGKPLEDGAPKNSPMGPSEIEAWARHLLRVDVHRDKNSGELKGRSLVSFGNDLHNEKEPIGFAINSGVEPASLPVPRSYSKPAGKPKRSRSYDTQARRSHIGDWIVENCQGMSRRDTADALAASDFKGAASTHYTRIGDGSYGGVGQVAPGCWQRELPKSA